MIHCPKWAAQVPCNCRYCAAMDWLQVCEDRIRDQMREAGDPLADDPTWHLALKVAMEEPT